MTLQEVIESFVDECNDDHVGLWRFVNAVKQDLGIHDPSEVRRLTMIVVQELLEKHRIAVGEPTSDWRGFVPWNTPSDQALERIDREWTALGRDPNVWEIAWFTSME